MSNVAVTFALPGKTSKRTDLPPEDPLYKLRTLTTTDDGATYVLTPRLAQGRFSKVRGFLGPQGLTLAAKKVRIQPKPWESLKEGENPPEVSSVDDVVRELRFMQLAGRGAHGVIEADGDLHILMDRMDGDLSSLEGTDRVSDDPWRKPLANDLATQLIAEAAWLHEVGIFHRDLKLANILIAKGRIRVADFGLATTRPNPTSTTGTRNYQAPEVINATKERPYNNTADTFSAGMIFLEVFTGHHPTRFRRQNASLPADLAAYTKEHWDMLLQPTIAIAKTRDPVLGSLIERMLTYDPAKRPTMRELHLHLQQHPLRYNSVAALQAWKDLHIGAFAELVIEQTRAQQQLWQNQARSSAAP